MQTYKENLTEDAITLTKQLTSNLRQIGQQLTADDEILQDTGQKQIKAKDIVEQEAKDLKLVLQQVLLGNKRRKGMFLYIILTYFIVSMVCRIF